MLNERIEIPVYCDRWMMGDRFGDLVKVSARNAQEVAHVKLDRSGKVVRVLLSDCRFS